jgi:hypothetical protein
MFAAIVLLVFTAPCVDERGHQLQSADSPVAKASIEKRWGPIEKSPFAVEGVAKCVRCHGVPTGATAGPVIPGIPDASDGWILGNELITWGQNDKHYQAYAVLLNERSKRMGEILGVTEIHRDARCLACHSAIPVAQLNADKDGLVPVARLKDPALNLGVSCEGCHGPSGAKNKEEAGWTDAHYRATPSGGYLFRTISAKEKYDNYGLWDVHSPTTQSQICTSCHIGNAEQGKVITHEMYAAGHPPLPAFELASFIAQMPRHWRYPNEKTDTALQKYLTESKTAYDPAQCDQTKRTLVAALVSLSDSLKLNADLIDVGADGKSEKPAYPELANFACYACHHELETPAWRQQRPLRTAPGRPLFHEWPLTVAEVAAGAAGVTPDDFEMKLQPLFAALGSQAFGEPDAVRRAARDASTWLDSLAVHIEQKGLTTDEARQALVRLAEFGAKRSLDYDSARQLAWAVERIHRDVQVHSAAAPQSATAGNDSPHFVPGPWGGWLADRPDPDAVESILKSLQVDHQSGLLVLDLRTGTSTTQKVGDDPTARKQVEVDLLKTLPPIRDYRPGKLNEAFQNLAEELKRQSPK